MAGVRKVSMTSSLNELTPIGSITVKSGPRNASLSSSFFLTCRMRCRLPSFLIANAGAILICLMNSGPAIRCESDMFLLLVPDVEPLGIVHDDVEVAFLNELLSRRVEVTDVQLTELDVDVLDNEEVEFGELNVSYF